jgi:hypothetical protein
MITALGIQLKNLLSNDLSLEGIKPNFDLSEAVLRGNSAFSSVRKPFGVSEQLLKHQLESATIEDINVLFCLAVDELESHELISIILAHPKSTSITQENFTQMFYRAVSSHSEWIVSVFLESHQIVVVPKELLEISFLKFIQDKNAKLAKQLMQSKAFEKIGMDTRNHAVIACVRMGQFDVLKRLEKVTKLNGITVETINEAFEIALSNDAVQLTKLLARVVGIQVYKKAFLKACLDGDIDLAKRLSSVKRKQHFTPKEFTEVMAQTGDPTTLEFLKAQEAVLV